MCSLLDPSWSDEWRHDAERLGAERAAASRRDGVRGVQFDTPPAAADLLTAVRAIGRLDPDGLSEDQRFGLLDVLEQAERMLTAANMATILATEARCGFDQRFGMTTGAYSEQRHGRDRRSWTRQARVGHILTGFLPDVHQALRDGRISVERATVIANALNRRNASLFTEAQQELLDLASAEHRFKEFARQVRNLAELADEDGPEPSEERSVGKVSRTGNHVAIVMDLYGADAIAAEQMIEAATDRLWRAEHAEAEQHPELVPRSRAELRAAAFFELIRLGTAADPASTTAAATELSLIIDADRADDLDPALAAVVAATDGGAFTGPFRRPTDPFTSHDPADQSELCGACGNRHDLPGRFRRRRIVVSTPDGERVALTPQQWQLLLCDSKISQTLLDVLGEPVAVRALDRFAGPTMRRSLTARDGGCTFPGCDTAPSWCDAHHVIEWSDDGRTVIANLALLCRRHHGIVHRSGWRMERNPDHCSTNGFFTITTASGCQMATQHRPRPAHRSRSPRPSAPPGRGPEPA